MDEKDENWAGKNFDREIADEIGPWPYETISDMPAELRETLWTADFDKIKFKEPKRVPLVYYRDDIVDDEHREEVGVADVFPDGTIIATMNDAKLDAKLTEGTGMSFSIMSEPTDGKPPWLRRLDP